MASIFGLKRCFPRVDLGWIFLTGPGMSGKSLDPKLASYRKCPGACQFLLDYKWVLVVSGFLKVPWTIWSCWWLISVKALFKSTWLCSRAFRISPIESLRVDTGQLSLQTRRYKLSLQYYMKLISNLDSPAYSSSKPCVPECSEASQALHLGWVSDSNHIWRTWRWNST